MHSLEPKTHIRLWLPDFWRMSAANLCLSMAMYMLFPILPNCIGTGRGNAILDGTFVSPDHWLIGLSIGMFGVGVYLLGAVCSYLLDAFRRKMVCLIALLVVLATTVVLSTCFMSVLALAFLRLLQGAAYGLVQMSLGSTLVLDLTDTRRRTEAGHSYFWFGRLALSLGPLVGLLVSKNWGVPAVFYASMALTAVALLFVARLHVPFRAPLQPKMFSVDRFWLPQGKWLFLNFLPVSTCVGLLLAVNNSYDFYGFIMVGFLLSLVAQRVVFVAADLRSEVVSGLLLIGAAMLLHITHNPALITYGASTMIGMGIGFVASRFLLYFIKVSEHCQRSTAQTTYMLCWESGLCLGFFIGFSLPADALHVLYVLGLTLCVAALIFYLSFCYKWLIKNRLR